MIKILMGGSPCTFWSIAQKNNREVEAEGMGWELFKNYLIAKEKFQPDFFLYENNKSASQAIKDQISKELNVDLMHINSALVSAQNRQRFYAFNWDVEQPEDRGILLKDILENGQNLTSNEKSYCLTASYDGAVAWNTIERSQRTMVAEPVGVGYRNRREGDNKLYRRFETHCEPKSNALTTVQTDSMVATPILFNETTNHKAQVIGATCYKDGLRNLASNDVDRRTRVAGPVRIGLYPNEDGECKGGQGNRIYSEDGKSITIQGNSGGKGGKTGLYAIAAEENQTVMRALDNIVDKKGYVPEKFNPYNRSEVKDKNPTLSTGSMITSSCTTLMIEPTGDAVSNVYQVSNGLITIKNKKYPIKLSDGFYQIRKLTPVECERLQTLPDNYTLYGLNDKDEIVKISNAQRYKGLGNGWTAEVIIHILWGALKNVPKDEEIIVLSMYDGIGTGHYCLEAMGFTNVKYYAYEIDKYAMSIARYNYPDIIECGDAFQVREDDWHLPNMTAAADFLTIA